MFIEHFNERVHRYISNLLLRVSAGVFPADTFATCAAKVGRFPVIRICNPYERPWAGQNCSINQRKSPAGGAFSKLHWDLSKQTLTFLSLERRGGHPTRRRWVSYIMSN